MTEPRLCPLGCELKEYRISGFLSGMQYGCQGGRSDGTVFATEYGAWICHKAFRELVKMRREGTAPTLDPELKENTRMIRASMRPQRMLPRSRAA